MVWPIMESLNGRRESEGGSMKAMGLAGPRQATADTVGLCPTGQPRAGCPYVILGEVIAPSAADLTSVAYFANTPVLYFGAGAFHSASLPAISASEISSS